MNYERAVVPKPPIGGKIWTVKQPGLFLLEDGPGLIWHALVTHLGSTGFELWDAQRQGDQIQLTRELFGMNPSFLGVWHLNAGFQHGLALRVGAGAGHVICPRVSVVWMRQGKTGAVEVGPRQHKTVTLGRKSDVVVTDSDCILYEILVPPTGRPPVVVKDGTGRELFGTPSGVNGSFCVEHVFCKGGFRLSVDTDLPVDVTSIWMPVTESQCPTP